VKNIVKVHFNLGHARLVDKVEEIGNNVDENSDEIRVTAPCSLT